MTKRLLSLFLVCILAIPIFSVTASATTIVEDVYSEEIFDELQGISDDVYQIEDYVRNIFNRIYELTLSGWQQNVNSWYYTIAERMTTIYTTIQGIDAVIKDECGKIVNKIQDVIYNVSGYFDSLKARISSEFEYLTDNLATWFDRQTSAIVSAIDTVIHGNAEKQPEIDDFEDDIAQKETEYQESMDIIQEATRPTYEDLDLSVDGIAGGEWGLGGFSDEYGLALYNIFGGHMWTSSLVFMAFMFAAISFVVFGKR